jgi:dihydroneopterin aldolase
VNTSLTLADLRLWVHLGVSAEEKTNPQAISVNIQIKFSAAPIGTQTDNLTETFCYFQMTEHIHAQLAKHPAFNLLEHLTGCIYASVYHDLLAANYHDAELEVRVNKLMPPILNLHGGVTFSCFGSLTQGKNDDLYQHWF